MFPFEEEQEIDPITGEPIVPAQEPVMTPPEQAAPAEMNPLVKDYLAKKFNLGDYNDEARKKVVDDNTGYDVRGSIGAALIAAGGGDAIGALKNRQAERQKAVDSFDKGRANKIQEYGLDRQFKKDSREDEDLSENSALDSQLTKTKQAIASKMSPGIDWTKMSGAKIDKMLPSVKTLAELDDKSQERKDRRAERDALLGIKQQDRKETSNKRFFDNLPEDKQLVIKELAKKNANKVAISNQIDSVMGSWDGLDEDQKVAQGRQLLKVLNSTEGADAIGAEEAKRLGAKIEFAMGNFTNSNPTQFGRDLEGFKTQATDTSKSLRNAIDSNQKVIDENYGRPTQEKKTIVKTQTSKDGKRKRIVYSDGTTEETSAVAGR